MKNILRLIKLIDSKFPNFIMLSLFFSLVTGILPLFNIIAPKFLIEEFVGLRRVNILFIYVALLLIFNFINQIVLRISYNYYQKIFEMFIDHLMYMLNEKSLKLPIELTDSKESQDKMEQSSEAIWYVFNLYNILSMVIGSVIASIFSLIILMSLNPLIPIFIIGLFFINQPLVKLIKKNELSYQKKSIPHIRIYRYFEGFARDFKYSKDLKIYDADDLILDRAKYHMNIMKDESHDYYTKNGIYTGLMNVINNSGIIGVLIYLTYGLTKKIVSIANFTLYFNSLIQLIDGLNLIQQNYAEVVSLNANLKVLFDFLDQEEGFLDKGKIDDMSLDEINIRFDNVSFKYPTGDDYILKDCSFEIKEGETVALVGKNGAGKSTIVKLLCKFYEPTKGDIYLNDINIKDINTRFYYKILSPTFQDFRLFPFMISENVTTKPIEDIKMDDKKELESSFKVLNVDRWIDNLSNKEDTYLTTLFDDKGVEPSGGIGQKIALSRSMFHKGHFIIMDEPTSALDPRSEEEIFKNMLNITKYQTSLFISHRLSSTKYADKILVCDAGKIIEEGDHKSLLNNNGLYKEMFDTQAELYS